MTAKSFPVSAVSKGAVCLLLYLILLFFSSSCAAAPTEEPEQPPAPVTVYDDGLFLVETVECLFSEEESTVILRLRVTNSSLRDTALSSVLGLRAECGGKPCELIFTDTPPDGLLKAGESREGVLKLKLPPAQVDAAQDSVRIELALDYLDGLWAEFTVSL